MRANWIALLFIVALVIWLFSHITGKNTQIPSDVSRPGMLKAQDFDDNEKGQTITKGKPHKGQNLPNRDLSAKPVADFNPAGFINVGILHSEVTKLSKFLNNNEAGRCQILLEKKYADAHEYFLEVAPPSREEIADTRNMIAEILEKAPKDKKEEIDNNISQLIHEYDAFGLLGKKILSIRVPDNPKSPLSAWTYPVNNVELEIQRIFSGEQIKAPENMQFYVGSDPKTMSRFEAIILYPETKK
jgi:hypothetical protein